MILVGDKDDDPMATPLVKVLPADAWNFLSTQEEWAKDHLNKNDVEKRALSGRRRTHSEIFSEFGHRHF